MTRYIPRSRQGRLHAHKRFLSFSLIHPGKEADRGSTGEGSVLFLSCSIGSFGALLRQQTGANVSAPRSFCKAGAGLAEAAGQLQPVAGHSKAG